MSEHEPTLLPRLTPPAGGLARLHARREQRGPATRPIWGLAAAASAGACCALLLLALRPMALEAPGLDRLRDVAASGAAPVLRDGQVAALPSRQPGVRLYWTASLRVDATARAW
jgi:hypothetical protein